MKGVAIITRTSNRPLYFQRCRKSVLAQGDVCKHYVISDSPADLSYLKTDIPYIHNVDKEHLNKSYNQPAPPSATPKIKSIHNLYFNEIYDKIQEPWIYHLDDDNELIPGKLQHVLKKIHHDTDLVIFRINHFTGKLPRDREFKNRIVRVAGIDTGCFMVKTSLMKTVKWDGWKCGDYRVIDKLIKLSNHTQWIDEVVMNMKQQNLGNRNDLK